MLAWLWGKLTAIIAGIPVEGLSGSRTAVFSASMEEDYTRMVSMDPENVERTAVTGSTVNSIIPNRVSWYFDMHGPSVHVNTACSSALAAFDLAYKTLQMGDASCVSELSKIGELTMRMSPLTLRSEGPCYRM